MSGAAAERVWLRLGGCARVDLKVPALRRELDASAKCEASLRRAVDKMVIEQEAPRRRPPAALEGTVSRLQLGDVEARATAAESAAADAKRRRRAADGATEKAKRKVAELKAALEEMEQQHEATVNAAVLAERGAAAGNVLRLEERLEDRAAEVARLGERLDVFKQRASELRAQVNSLKSELEVKSSLESKVEQLTSKIKSISEKLKKAEPLTSRKEGVGPRALRHRRQHARERLLEVLKCSDLRASDIASALEETDKVELVFDSRIFWEQRMVFAADLSDTLGWCSPPTSRTRSPRSGTPTSPSTCATSTASPSASWTASASTSRTR